jgi:hypothetical protein
VAALLCGLALFAAAPAASAWPAYPGYIQEIAGMDCAPSCLLCHTSPEGGATTVRAAVDEEGDLGPARGFGIFVQNLIIQSDVPISAQSKEPPKSAMESALFGLRDKECFPGSVNPCDSDDDGVKDWDELVANTDPDDKALGASLCIGPRYGCGARVSPEAPRPFPTVALLSALGIALVLFRRFRS